MDLYKETWLNATHCELSTMLARVDLYYIVLIALTTINLVNTLFNGALALVLRNITALDEHFRHMLIMLSSIYTALSFTAALMYATKLGEVQRECGLAVSARRSPSLALISKAISAQCMCRCSIACSRAVCGRRRRLL